MKKTLAISGITILITTLLFAASCSNPGTSPVVLIRVSIYGTSANPVNVSWTIHSASGSSTLRLNHSNSAPLTIERSVGQDTYGPVEITITDAGATGNNQVQDSVSLGGVTATAGPLDPERRINLGADFRVGGLFPVDAGDYLTDNNGDIYLILQNPDPLSPDQLVVSDSRNTFTDGTWELYTSNRSNVTVIIERDYTVLQVLTDATESIDTVNMGTGSLVW